MKKLITILFGILLLGFVSCTNSTTHTPAPEENDNNTISFDDFTYNVVYKYWKGEQEYEDVTLNISDTAHYHWTGSSRMYLYKDGKKLVFQYSTNYSETWPYAYSESNNFCYLTLKNDKVSYEWFDQYPKNLPYDEIRTVTIDYNAKKITFFLDWNCF